MVQSVPSFQKHLFELAFPLNVVVTQLLVDELELYMTYAY
jgi:hypothetical protein